jgi:hypothetical protein
MNGFIINGIDTLDSSANIASIGDFNGDQIADILIGGAFYAASSPLTFADNGIVQTKNYVIFGKTTSWTPIFELSSLEGTNGFVLDGFTPGIGGHAVASAGDFNQDGLGDILIGSPTESPYGKTSAGRCYVVFGDRSIQLLTNQLSVVQGQSIILNNMHLSAYSGNFIPNAVQFSVSNVQWGQFELVNQSGVVITQFTQLQLDTGLIRFVHDGSNNAPSYFVVASTGYWSGFNTSTASS